MESLVTASHLTFNGLKRSVTQIRFRKHMDHNKAEIGHMLLLNTSSKPYTGEYSYGITFDLEDREKSKSPRL